MPHTTYESFVSVARGKLKINLYRVKDVDLTVNWNITLTVYFPEFGARMWQSRHLPLTGANNLSS